MSLKLVDVARVVRSKNAGPTTLTLDLLFNDTDGYERACAAPALRAAAIAARYGVPAERVQVMPYPAALAMKISLDRRVVAGDPGDRDVYGAQQHAPLLEIEL
jgi:hypothetical protein